MSKAKKISVNREDVEVRHSNWLFQAINMVMPKNLFAIIGRGGGKTTDELVERIMEMVYDLPGAPCALVADTYSNLQKNVFRTLLEGFKLKGWHEGIHFVVETEPPDHFEKPYNIFSSYKHTWIFFTGFNFTFVSLDRPAIAAGNSFVHLVGDECKYFPEIKISRLIKAVRGYRLKYSDSPFYRGLTFTTDMPDINNIGEYDWILKLRKNMDIKQIILILRCGFILNEVKKEYVRALDTNDKKKIELAFKKIERWEERWRKLRYNSTLFFKASSFINVAILGIQYFVDEFRRNLDDVKQAILSLKPSLNAGNRFYTNLAEKHFYKDGNDTYWSHQFGIKDVEDCRILKYLDKNKAIEAGVDFGNMLSMVIGQPGTGNKYRLLKDMFTLPNNWVRELADLYLDYFKEHTHKYLELRYDRAGNAYKQVGADLATKLKKSIEVDNKGKRTGWKVTLISVNQGNIESWKEYDFMIELLGGNNPKLPNVLIDMYNCKCLKSSLELAPVKIVTRKGKKYITKDKTSERLPTHLLPLKSTNFSDAFKYLMCRTEWMKLVKGLRSTSVGSVSVRG